MGGQAAYCGTRLARAAGRATCLHVRALTDSVDLVLTLSGVSQTHAGLGDIVHVHVRVCDVPVWEICPAVLTAERKVVDVGVDSYAVRS